jgi:hypothetical protein
MRRADFMAEFFTGTTWSKIENLVLVLPRRGSRQGAKVRGMACYTSMNETAGY